MNKAQLKGNLVKDNDLRYIGEKGTAKLTNTIAINEEYNGKKSTAYIPIEIWGERAEQFSNTYNKGALVDVEGKIITGSYTKQDGTKVYTWGVNVFKFGGEKVEQAKKNILNALFPDATVTDDDLSDLF
jgi:single-strand DNA-binding protein